MARKKKEIKMTRVCEKCGAHQKPDPKKSNENWNVYPTDELCKCGGKFVMKFEE